MADFYFDNLVVLSLIVAFAAVMYRLRSHTHALRQRLEEEARQHLAAIDQEKHYSRLIIDTAPSLIWVTDKSMVIIAANQSFADVFNETIEAMIGQPLSRFIKDEKLLHKISLSTVEILQSGHTEHGNDFYLKNLKTGQWQTYALSRRVLHNGVRGVITVAQDVTTLKSTLEALRVTQEHYAKLVEQSNNLILQISSEMLITYANSSSVKFLAIPPHALIGMEWLEIIAPNDRDLLRRQFTRWSSWATRHEERWECKIIGAGTQVKSVLWAITIIWQDDHFKGLQVSGVDITARLQQETELKQAKGELQEKNQILLHEQQRYIALLETYEKTVRSSLINP